MTIHLKQQSIYLTRATDAIELCKQILQSPEEIVLDFAGVVQMTPSYVNALFFNLAHHLGIERVKEIQIVNAESWILETIEKSISRKENGAELTCYVLV